MKSIAAVYLVLLSMAATGVHAESPRFYDRVVVLTIAVNQYASEGIRDLSEAENDAKRLAHIFESQYGFEVDSLIGHKATKANIKAKLQQYAKEQSLGAHDALIIYFAMHGHLIKYVEIKDDDPRVKQVGYLLPQDAALDQTKMDDTRDWQRRAISMRWLIDEINAMSADHVLVIADTCCSGFLTTRGSLDTRERRNLLSEKSRTVMSATTKNESASEGVFTPALAKILSSTAEPLSVTDVFSRVRPTVSNHSHKLTGTKKSAVRPMTPQMSHVGAGDGEFIFFPLSIPRSQTTRLRLAVDRIKKLKTDEDGVRIAAEDFAAVRGVFNRFQERSGQQTTLKEVVATFMAPDYWFGENAEAFSQHWAGMKAQFEENAAMQDPLAMAALHYVYSKGLGGTTKSPDFERAYEISQAANAIAKPRGVSECLLGRCYKNGWGVTSNDATATRLFKQSAESGFVLGKFGRAIDLLSRPTEPKVREAIGLLAEIEADVPAASHVLAAIHASGSYPGVPADYLKSAAYYDAAFMAGDMSAATAVYEAYSAGIPGFPPRNAQKAEQALRKSASRGNAPAQFALGCELCRLEHRPLYLNLHKDVDNGLKWLRQAREQNLGIALHTWALLHCDPNDLGVRRDAELARKYLRGAEAEKYPLAYSTLSNWYLGNDGIFELNPKQALHYAKLAAEHVPNLGLYQLGNAYFNAIGIDVPDGFKAFTYHHKSAEAMHYFMRCVQTAGVGVKESDEHLQELAGAIRLERQGIPWADEGVAPSAILRYWKRQFPDTAVAFEKKYLDARR